MARRFDSSSTPAELEAQPAAAEPATAHPTELGAPAPAEQPPPPPPPPAAPAAERLTPHEWALRKGLVVATSAAQPWVETHAKGFHAEADVLHSWSRYAAAYQAPEQAFRLTEEDYDAARAAAAQFPTVPAHKAAVPPHMPVPEQPEHLKPKPKAEATAAAPTTPGV